ncbi:hypothetical protein [Halobacillus sp. BAB-2008]|uniref:hypothetical protein n=1 Tax=Halobacillus sp. BAB-2008 TaxID=1246484 RepID=UPI0002A513CA|nr:hypothetical protein [Halobacillus sp. BAB-2008]ELK48545.1 hypothetical protein D479_02977 [Halobacillus sp. BAB-2008]
MGSFVEHASKARAGDVGKDDRPWYLYKCTDSEYLDWYDEQPGPGRDIYSIQHHVITTSETTFDIRCTYEPRITYIEEKDNQESRPS